MGSTTLIIIAVLAASTLILIYRLIEAEKNAADLRSRYQQEKEYARAAHDRIERIISILLKSNGGIQTRIEENISITKEIEKFSPNLFKDSQFLIYWLNSHQQFLELIYESTDQERNYWDQHNIDWVSSERERKVFSRVFKSIGKMQPKPENAI